MLTPPGRSGSIQPPMPEETRPSEPLPLQLQKVTEKYRLARLAVLCGSVLVGMTIICVTTYKVMEKPPYVEITLAAIAAVTTVIGAVRPFRRRAASYSKAILVRLWVVPGERR